MVINKKVAKQKEKGYSNKQLQPVLSFNRLVLGINYCEINKINFLD
jgi:hypothetical protein